MRLSFVGAGYVGLVSATLLSYLGHEVTCIDNNATKIDSLNSGIVPIYEPQLEEYIKQAINKQKLTFSSKHSKADAVFIAVGTPPLESGEADLRYIYSATLEAAKVYGKNTLIIIKSTVPPSTCSKLQQYLSEQGYEHEIASNPEFLREGSAIEDFLKPDRIVVGTSSDRAAKIMAAIYRPLTDEGFKMLYTNITTSELIKYASNAFLATKIGFINEMANLCETLCADIDTLSKGMGMDHRIGSSFLKAGPGFGGSCFPKDILALSYLAHQNKQPCRILDSVIASNQDRMKHMVTKITNALGNLQGKTLAILGITFKAGTDDVRSSPALEIAYLLQKAEANLRIYDPEGMKNAAELIKDVTFTSSSYEATESADAVIILTEWEEFAQLDFDRIKSLIKAPVIFDLRNILDQSKLAGFEYHKIG